MKYIQLYVLFLTPVLQTSCGQNQTNLPKDNPKPEIKDIVTAYGPDTMVRNVKKGRNGTILMNAWALSRYDAKSLYDKMSVVTGIKARGGGDFPGIPEVNDASIWFGSMKRSASL
ncbi:hypothetical protein [Chitinophaga niabensis]|uniref:Uncharacterized protein n=1 Tax=Chitinophaga niabensis TaxID=536979 RepID=A0A1N6FY35_9BACT|nr:hypothetical protein [Chitinophaga niabensis]SIO00112.1 hypothetical protein SAMN04488055_2474 [Chitinophaga niabensis]